MEKDNKTDQEKSKLLTLWKKYEKSIEIKSPGNDEDL